MQDLGDILDEVADLLSNTSDSSTQLDASLTAWYVLRQIDANIRLPKETRRSILTLPSVRRAADEDLSAIYTQCVLETKAAVLAL